MSAEIKTRKQLDAEIDARRAADHKRCKGCDYYTIAYNLGFWHCNYALREDRPRKRNKETGECESFTPKRKKTQKERIEERRHILELSEADNKNKLRSV